MKKQTRLINSLPYGQRMREGQPSLKGFCDLGLKLESCWVTDRQDDVNKFLHPQAIPQLIKLIVLLTGTFTDPVTAFLILILSLWHSGSVYDFTLKT